VDQRVNVPTQAALLALCSSLAAIISGGHLAGFANVVVLGIGIALWLGFAAAYRLRAKDRPDAERRDFDRRAAQLGFLGYAVPLAVSMVLWLTPSFDGVLVHSAAGAFCAVLLTVFWGAMLTSSMVDWYYILPLVFGLIGPPIWMTDAETVSDRRGELDDTRRRRIAQVWVFHRGVCEILTFSCVAFFLAVVLVAAGNALSSDTTLPTAFESLGGAGAAVGVLGYVGPRVGGGLRFMLSTEVGLGEWVQRTHEETGLITADGLVVDVSIEPGVKIIQRDGTRKFAALAETERLHPIARPGGIDSAWCSRAVHDHLGRDPKPQRAARETQSPPGEPALGEA
jgi:hypothetical protein